MSIRITALYIFTTALSIYAFKDWFKSLCGLILLMAVIRHEDMPTKMFGIQGFNLWNILFLVIFIAWLISRRREGLTWDMPLYITVLLIMYLGVIIIGVLRAAFDPSWMRVDRIISEYLINTIKWIIPGILIFDGCRTRSRVIMVLICLLVMYFLISAQVVKRMPFQSAFATSSDDRIHRMRLKTCKSIGYSAVDMSTFLAGASWGVLAMFPIIHRKKYQILLLLASGFILFGQILTGGRAGYLAWGCIGLVLCLIKWRKYLILAPVIVILVPIALPGTYQRIMTGFGQTDVAGQEVIDTHELSSGRFQVWPYVIDMIYESPMIGYGRMAMVRSGLQGVLGFKFGWGDAFPHPHNMYLETLLENGILGSLPLFLFWGTIVICSGKLFRSKNRLCAAVGGLALSLTLAQLFAGVGSQHFYPEESTFGAWVSIFLSLRVYIEQARIRERKLIAESTCNSQTLYQQAMIPAVVAQEIA